MRDVTLHYDREGRPISMKQWCVLYATGDGDSWYGRVARTCIGDVEVSTVWLGLDHNFGDEGPPLIFETLIRPEDEAMWRYPTEAAALAGHDQAVTYVQSGDYARDCRAQAALGLMGPDAAMWSPASDDEDDLPSGA